MNDLTKCLTTSPEVSESYIPTHQETPWQGATIHVFRFNASLDWFDFEYSVCLQCTVHANALALKNCFNLFWNWRSQGCFLLHNNVMQTSPKSELPHMKLDVSWIFIYSCQHHESAAGTTLSVTKPYLYMKSNIDVWSELPLIYYIKYSWKTIHLSFVTIKKLIEENKWRVQTVQKKKVNETCRRDWVVVPENLRSARQTHTEKHLYSGVARIGLETPALNFNKVTFSFFTFCIQKVYSFTFQYIFQTFFGPYTV